MKRLLLSSALLLGLIKLSCSYRLENSESDSSEHGVIETGVATNCSCGWANKEDQRIVGGKTTKVNEYPMIAGFVHLEKDIVLCGGTILTERHIVTAAHCTEPFFPFEYGIFVGHHNYKEVKSTKQLLEPEKFFIHDKYDGFTLKYDISIVLMKEPIEFDAHVGPACLPTARIPLVGERVKILGWGRTKYKGDVSEVLLKVNVDVQEFDTCKTKNRHLELNDIHQLCTYRKYKDSCSGDSGGPLLWIDPDTNRYTLVAATSYGTNCAKYPAVNSDIVYFLPWIQKTISETDSSQKTCAKV